MRKNGTTRRAILCAALIFALTFGLCFFQVFQTHDWGDDFAQYIAQARAVVENTVPEFLQANGYIVSHSPISTGEYVAPWGFPLLLAPVYALFGVQLTLFKMIEACMLALAAATFFLILNRLFRFRIALVGGICYAMNQSLLLWVNYIQSDVPFLTLVLLCLYVLLCADEEHAVLPAVLFGLFGGYAWLCRSQGIYLFVCLFVCQIVSVLRRRKGCDREGEMSCFLCRGGSRARTLLIAGIPYCILAAVVALASFLPHSPRSALYFLPYVTWDGVLSRISVYFHQIAMFFPLPDGPAEVLLYGFSLLAVLGWIVRRGKPLFFTLYGAGVFLMAAIFPWAQVMRYIMPLSPLYVIWLLYGFDFLLTRIRLPAAAFAVFGIALCCAFGYRSVAKCAENMSVHREFQAGAYSEDAKDAYRYIRANTPDDAVIAFFKPRLLWLETGRLSYQLESQDGEGLSEADYLLTTADGDYLDMGELRASLAALSEAGKEIRLQEVYENDRFWLYKVE